MARQAGMILITGTIQNITFYEMGGQYYARLKSSLRGDRVKRDPAFARTMAYAERLALASRTAAQLYRTLPVDQRKVAAYRKMTSTAMQLLKAGIPAAMLAAALAAAFQPIVPPKEKVVGVEQQPSASISQTGRLAWHTASRDKVMPVRAVNKDTYHGYILSAGIFKREGSPGSRCHTWGRQGYCRSTGSCGRYRVRNWRLYSCGNPPGWLHSEMMLEAYLTEVQEAGKPADVAGYR